MTIFVILGIGFGITSITAFAIAAHAAANETRCHCRHHEG